MIQDSDLTVEELQQQINDYEEQLAVVDAALAQDPDQPEFLEVKTNLVDVLNVTKDLLRLKKETAPPIVYDNIQEIASRWGFFVGMKCEARWSEDNQWYPAVVTSITPKGFDVKFTEYGDTDTVGPEDIKKVKDTDVVVVDASKTQQASVKTQEKTTLVIDKRTGTLVIPTSLKVLPNDPESVKKMKKKTKKALKNEYRKLKSEEERNKRKGDWQSFQAKKRARTNSSIFKSPDSVDGRVGVTGSGKGMTSFETQKYKPKKLASTLPVAPLKQ